MEPTSSPSVPTPAPPPASSAPEAPVAPTASTPETPAMPAVDEAAAAAKAQAEKEAAEAAAAAKAQADNDAAKAAAARIRAEQVRRVTAWFRKTATNALPFFLVFVPICLSWFALFKFLASVPDTLHETVHTLDRTVVLVLKVLCVVF